MSLNDQIADFLAQADAHPARSKLEPYAELIRELRQRRWTFTKIAAALHERFAVTASPSTIYDFVRVRGRRPKAEVHSDLPMRPLLEPAALTPRKRRFHLEM